jgi:hypothetical protein
VQVVGKQADWRLGGLIRQTVRATLPLPLDRAESVLMGKGTSAAKRTVERVMCAAGGTLAHRVGRFRDKPGGPTDEASELQVCECLITWGRG